MEEGSQLAGATDAAIGSPANEDSVSDSSASEFNNELDEDENVSEADLEIHDVSALMFEAEGAVPPEVAERDKRNDYAELIHYMPLERKELEKKINADVKDYRKKKLHKKFQEIAANFKGY